MRTESERAYDGSGESYGEQDYQPHYQNLTQRPREERALDHVCPACKARPGQWCLALGGESLEHPHREREDKVSDTRYYDYALGHFQPGQRVELHPATDLWMRGARYGEVVSIGRKYVAVKLDRTGRTHKFIPGLLRPVESRAR